MEMMPPEVLGQFLCHEHPQTIALILSKVTPAFASNILLVFSEDIKNEIMYRISKLGGLPLGALEDLEECLLKELNQIDNSKASGVYKIINGVNVTAKILQSFDQETEERTLSYLDEEDNPLAEEVRRELKGSSL